MEASVKLLSVLVISCVVSRLEAVGVSQILGGNNRGNFPSFVGNHRSSSDSGLVSDDDDAEVGFFLLTKETTDSPVEAKIEDEGKLFEGKFNASKPTKIIIHGWLDTWEKVYSQTMIASYLPAHDYNVIVVNWPEADNKLYFPSRYKVPAVGKIVARFLDRLRNENGLNLSSVHVLGHSLGAHVGAVAGYSLKDARIGKITALDPALPLFSVGGADTLSQEAADYVEVVHTCGNFLGMLEEIGHVDFYPNGGTPFQPGCFLSLDCSHKRSFVFYSEAIANPTAFLGTACSDWKTYENGGCSKNQQIFLNDATPISLRNVAFNQMDMWGKEPFDRVRTCCSTNNLGKVPFDQSRTHLFSCKTYRLMSKRNARENGPLNQVITRQFTPAEELMLTPEWWTKAILALPWGTTAGAIRYYGKGSRVRGKFFFETAASPPYGLGPQSDYNEVRMV